jgi:hypothetical protein
MTKVRGIAMVLFLAGAALLVYGIWDYMDSRTELRIGDARVVVENASVSPAVWGGGALILAALIIGGGSVMTGKRKSN